MDSMVDSNATTFTANITRYLVSTPRTDSLKSYIQKACNNEGKEITIRPGALKYTISREVQANGKLRKKKNKINGRIIISWRNLSRHKKIRDD